MSTAKSRLSKISSHVAPFPGQMTADMPHITSTSAYKHEHNFHALSPTYFLARAAAIEPEALALYHVTSNNKVVRRSYGEFAQRAQGFAYYLLKHGYRRVGILAPNTPGFLEALFGIGAANAVNIAVNYRLKKEDVGYIFQHSKTDAILVDAEFVHLLNDFTKANPQVKIILDTDTDATDFYTGGDFDRAVLEGLEYDRQSRDQGWHGLSTQADDETKVISLAYTSGTTAKPKGVEYTHRGVYLAALANVIESGLNVDIQGQRARYLWILPMFHANGWTFPWAVTSVRATHYCLRKIEYPAIWNLLKTEDITHYNAAPTVNTLLCADQNAVRLTHPVRVTVAASPPTPHLFRTMTNLNLHPVHVYGLTETYGPITKCYYKTSWLHLSEADRFDRMARQGYGFITSTAARVIKPNLPPTEIVDVNKDGKQIGEIVLSGNICAKGYYRDDDATRALWAGGVCHTGDLAVWHPNGEIQILDRAKDIIISGEFFSIGKINLLNYSAPCRIFRLHFSEAEVAGLGGENISSVALESMLARHPDILEVAVVAVQDDKWGERPKAFVTLRQAKQHVRGEHIIQWAREQSSISNFMIPREIEIVPELPKTSTGKTRKNVLRQWANGADGQLD